MHEYEQRGVAATQDMQRAARAVALENTRLRALLARHGVVAGEVEAWLRSFQGAGEEVVGQAARKGSGILGDGIQSRGGDAVGRGASDSSTTPDRPPEDPPAPAALPPAPTPAADPPPLLMPESPIATCSLYPPSAASHPDACPSTDSCFCPPMPAARDVTPRSGLEISCEAAATIIAEMRGDGDREAVCASLGCGPGEVCTVKNATVLQIMNES